MQCILFTCFTLLTSSKRRWWLGEEMHWVWSIGSKTKCIEYEVEGPRPKRTWREVVKEDCQARKLNTEDAMEHSKWRKFIKDVRWSGWVWVGECFFWYRPTRVVPDQRPLNSCVCVCVTIDWLSCIATQDSFWALSALMSHKRHSMHGIWPRFSSLSWFRRLIAN